MSAPAAFDSLAGSYDSVWTNSREGRLQRDQVWRVLERTFRPGDRVLDLGCGTGEDAKFLAQRGVRVLGIDSSGEMIHQARRRTIEGAAFETRRIEDLAEIEGRFDGAISNFGALNCVRDLSFVAKELARLLAPGSPVVICVLSRFCLGETARFARQGQFRKACRRWTGETEWRGTRVYYRSQNAIREAFAPHFRFVDGQSVGARFLGDHRLLRFVREQAE